MRTTTTTSLRKELFGVIEKAICSVPTRIHSKKGDAIILSYPQYQSLKGQKKKKGRGLQPLLKGRILKPLNEEAEEELIRYIGF